MNFNDYTLQFRVPTVLEYQFLRNTTNWAKLSNQSIAKGLMTSLFSICILDTNAIVASGRVIGDNAMYFYIPDVIVIPSHQKKGLGKLVMEHLLNYISREKEPNAFIGLMSAEGVNDFHRQFGFAERPPDRPGMWVPAR